MSKYRDKFSITTWLFLLGLALLSLEGCFPMKQVRVWQPIGGRSVSAPSFSPDGKNIVFQARPHGEMKRQIFVSRLDGTGERNLTQHQSTNWAPAWSPDGQFIFFQSNRDGQSEIYRMRNDGTELKNISENPADDESFDLSPDGKNIVFVRRASGALPKEASLLIASTDGSNQRVLVNGSWGARWSPDGQWILHKRGGDAGAWIIRPDGSGERRIDTNGLELAWTPNSSAIFYFQQSNIYVVNLDGTGKKLVLRNVEVGLGLLPRCSWDTSGLRLAIAVNPGIGEARKGIVLLDRHGDLIADFRQMSAYHFYSACWSIDGKTIWFLKTPFFGSETKGGIYKMKEDGTEEQQVIPDDIVWEQAPPLTEEEWSKRIKEIQE